MTQPKVHLEKTICYIFGRPGVGKASVARKILDQTDMIMIENHQISDLLRHVAGEQVNDLVEPIKNTGVEISKIVLDFMGEYCAHRSYVLTSVLYENDPDRRRWFDYISEWCEVKGWKFVPVALECDWEELQTRVQHKNRVDHGFKLTDVDTAKELYDRYQVLKPSNRHSLTLDTTDLAVSETALAVVDHLKSLK